MDVRERDVWRVQSGGVTRWFGGELGARNWADDRFDTEFDGVPFIERITLTEALTRLNELEASK
jgi:hypothetical protein